MAPEKTIFTYLNSIYYKKEIPYDKKIAPAYMLSLWLSHDKGLIDIVDKINEYQFLISDELIYQYYYYKVPSGSRYIKWVKKDEVDKKAKEKYDAIRKDMMLSKKEMSHYLPFTNLLEYDKVKPKKKVENASSVFL